MDKSDLVTCSFTVGREIYDAYKSIVSAHGQTVKENLVNYMMDVIASEIPNSETIETIEETQELKKYSAKKTYGSLSESCWMT